MAKTDEPQVETEVIGRKEEENGDYSFTFIMTMPPKN